MKAKLRMMGLLHRIIKRNPRWQELAWVASSGDAIAGNVEVMVRGGGFYYVAIGE